MNLQELHRIQVLALQTSKQNNSPVYKLMKQPIIIIPRDSNQMQQLFT